MTYEKQVRFTTHGPVGVNVLIAPRPGGLWSLQPVLSNELIQGSERLTAIERRLAATTTTAGVNGDVTAAGGRPDGFLMRNGVLDHDPRTARSSAGIDTGGGLHVDRLSLYGYWQGAKSRRAFNVLNEPPLASGTALYTPAWGPATPAAANGVAVVLRPFPPAAANTDLVGTSAQIVPGGAAAIPPDGAVLVARGAAATALQAEAPVGQAVRIRFAILPDWPGAGVTAGLGGGPVLVRNGKPIFKAGESIPVLDLALRQPRTAVGQRADGSIVMITVDGGLPGAGMTNFELGQTLAALGAVTGVALAGGPAAGMAFEGKLLSTAPRGGAPPLADALLVEYAGVVASPPSATVVSPNGDNVAETESFTYKVVRPSTVTVQLKGPDGGLRVNTETQLAPGTYPFQWNARRTDGTPEQEGPWSFTVSVGRRSRPCLESHARLLARPHTRLAGGGRGRTDRPARRPAARGELHADATGTRDRADRDVQRAWSSASSRTFGRSRQAERGLERQDGLRRQRVHGPLRRPRHRHERGGHERPHGAVHRPAEVGWPPWPSPPSPRTSSSATTASTRSSCSWRSRPSSRRERAGDDLCGRARVRRARPAARHPVRDPIESTAAGVRHGRARGDARQHARRDRAAGRSGGAADGRCSSATGSGCTVTPKRLDRAEALVRPLAGWAAFLGRLAPVIRSFISIPAGVFREPLVPYLPHARRLRDLVLRARRRGLGGRARATTRCMTAPLRGYRDRRARGRGSRVPVVQKTLVYHVSACRRFRSLTSGRSTHG